MMNELQVTVRLKTGVWKSGSEISIKKTIQILNRRSDLSLDEVFVENEDILLVEDLCSLPDGLYKLKMMISRGCYEYPTEVELERIELEPIEE